MQCTPDFEVAQKPLPCRNVGHKHPQPVFGLSLRHLVDAVHIELVEALVVEVSVEAGMRDA